MQRLLVPLFTFFWWNKLYAVTPTHHSKIHVVKVKGWRTALVDRVGCGRETIAFCFWWFK